MDEILGALPAGARVLDVGAAEGSFPAGRYPVRTTQVDLDAPTAPAECFVVADAACLPFASGAFSATIANHSLEHIANLDKALQEIARVTRRDGSLFVSVPDAGTVADRMYRFLASGGGHVNAFRSLDELSYRIAAATGMRFRGSRPLLSSLSILHPVNRGPGRRAALLKPLTAPLLARIMRWIRRFDLRFGTRLGHYGWALYFGEYPGEIRTDTWQNVCIRCGSGHPPETLPCNAAYFCPRCGERNLAL